MPDSGRAAKAQAILDALDGGVVAERPKYRAATVLACESCGHRFGIAHARDAEKRTWHCACGGVAKVCGYWARLEPLSKQKEAKGA